MPQSRIDHVTLSRQDSKTQSGMLYAITVCAETMELSFWVSEIQQLGRYLQSEVDRLLKNAMERKTQTFHIYGPWPWGRALSEPVLIYQGEGLITLRCQCQYCFLEEAERNGFWGLFTTAFSPKAVVVNPEIET